MVAEENKNMVLGGSAIKPEGWDRSGFETFKYFLYDPKAGTVLSRTPISWFKIIVFYLIYYTFLAGFWLACLHVFFLTMPENVPRRTLSGSLIGTNPGVGRRPSNDDLHIDSSIITLEAIDSDDEPTNDKGEGEKNADWRRRAELFMEKYTNTSGLEECTENKENGKCIFKPADVLGDCAEYPYGYISQSGERVKPCVFLKFNKIWDWNPTPINPENLDDQHYDDMTDGMKQIIRDAEDPNHIWLDCFGRFPADREAFKVNFFPENRGIPIKHFPYTGGNYHQPLVALQLESEHLTDTQVGQLIHIECRAWYDGVQHSTKDMAGLIRFEFLLKNRSAKP